MTTKKILALLCSVFVIGLPIAARADVPTVTSSGSIAATGQFGQVNLSGQSVCRIRLDGLAVLTFNTQMTQDGTSWFGTQTTLTSGISGTQRGGGIANPFNGFFEVYVGGAQGLRLNVSAYTSGTETYVIVCSGAPPQFGVSMQFVYDSRVALIGQQQGDAVQGIAWTTTGGSLAGPMAPSVAGPTVIRASASRIARLFVTTAGTSSETFFDNASACSGTVLFVTPTTTTVGQIFDLQVPAASGITGCGGAGSPGLTIVFY